MVKATQITHFPRNLAPDKSIKIVLDSVKKCHFKSITVVTVVSRYKDLGEWTEKHKVLNKQDLRFWVFNISYLIAILETESLIFSSQHRTVLEIQKLLNGLAS